MLNPLQVLVRAVQQADTQANFYFVGDYVNRGPDSKGVIDFLLKLGHSKFCRGNHDDIFDLMVNGQSFAEAMTHNNRPAAFKWFMEHGLDHTFISYGATVQLLKSVLAHPTDPGIDALASLVPEAHKKFIRSLPSALEEPDFFVIHAKWEPLVPDEDPSPSTYIEVDSGLHQTVTWSRFTAAEIDAEKTWRRTAYFGHTPVDAYGARGGYDPHGGGHLVPIFGNKMVLTDTAAAVSPVGRLTAVCADTGKFIQCDRQGKIVPTAT